MTQTVSLAHLRSSKPSAAESSSRKTLHGLALAVAKAKRIVVVTGAGISCSSGIPDFRSTDGLYNLVKERYPDVVIKGRDLFDAALFRDPMSAAVFYTFMAELKTQIDSAHPAPVHDFLAMLDDKGKLLRSYTQNIDGLEERAGLGTQDLNAAATGNAGQRTKNVQLHGDIHRVRCTLCSASYPCSPDHIAAFRTGTPPDCPECIARSDARTARSARALKCGTLRPAIVLYDEPHPLGDHIGAVQTSDLGKRPDLLIVMGTSLKVHGLRLLVKSFAKAVHSSRPSPSATSATSHSFLHNVIFVNRTPPPPGEWTSIIDYHIQGDTDTWVGHVLGEWKKSRPGDWEVQMSLDDVVAAKGGKLKDVKDKAKAKDSKALKGKGKDTNIKVKGGKSKTKAPNSGSENQPPPSEDSSSKQRLVVTIRRAARIAQSPLHTTGVKARKRKPALAGKGKAPLGTPTPMKTPVRQASLATPAKSSDLPALSFNPTLNPTHMFTPMRPAQKRSAPSHSPFVPGVEAGQRRIDAMLSASPAHKRAAVSTPTPGARFRPHIVRSPSVVRSPGYVSGLLRGSSVVSGFGKRMGGGMVASTSETGTETTASETGALTSASASDAGMDTTDGDDPSGPSVTSSRVDFDFLARGDPSTQSSAYASENEGVDQEDMTDGEEDEAETEEVDRSDGEEAEEENEEVAEGAEETLTFSQLLDQVDSEDMVMDSPDEIPEMKNLTLPSKPGSRMSTLTQVSHVSSQASRTSTRDSRLSSQSTQDSIFSRQGSQDTPASSQEDGPMAGSSQTITCPSSQTQLDLSQTITNSPPPSLSSSPKQDKSRRYLGNPRPAPFGRTKSVGDGVLGVRSMARHASMGSASTRHVSNPKPSHSDPFARPVPRAPSGNWSTYHAKSGARRPGGRPVHIPIPGVDVGVSASGERFTITSSSSANTDMDSDSSKESEDTPLAQRCRVSIAAPSPESGSSSRQSSEKRELGLILSPNMAPKDHEPRKRNRLKHDSNSGMDNDEEPHRGGLLFTSLKGKEKESNNEMAMDADSMSDEDDGLDGAVGHMSLDGPSTDPDPDVDVVGMSSGAEQTAIALSPILTRARRRVKDVPIAVPKRGKRAPPRSGTRTSSRLAAMASIS
ncbi:unnamed protein product [Rhizoctonia solani]|uniref:Deacetylase sirtuin-type domain-containing protein n=3 Tax=Rhizoctonia solani TaxID=456999 RepID=A0A8H3CPT6_9AGAM|nr:sirtuin 5 and-related class III sirtuin, putative [Rhizoctonia solani AG-3 Rhs1AP]KEP52168.1 putative sirtuin 5 and-related class III sirtuin [Rhizoctonia solani 123E]CAE6489535.1 unnamed protein product [Rhizoctonia solani]